MHRKQSQHLKSKDDENEETLRSSLGLGYGLMNGENGSSTSEGKRIWTHMYRPSKEMC